ncbi:hypothetical protein [Leucothrix arctica]|uniref:Uncharacterized protein n=1 Tax=Leucothrix arctica TaxID=1481894 RepID=A0A317C931_9GAMM|nr:hypothetical protein [Leucothrix arctica]PWQ95056.1 hypothetical protein DKT75_13630 [Leucothrix arctica]
MVVSPENELKEFIAFSHLLRRRLGMYVYPTTLAHLGSFLGGYFQGVNREDVSTYYNFFQHYQPSFHDWIAEKENGRNAPANSWVDMIMNNVDSDEAGIERFFNYLDEYINKVALKASNH